MNNETLDRIKTAHIQDLLEMIEAEREYELFEKPFELTAIEKIDEIYNQAIRDLENLIR